MFTASVASIPRSQANSEEGYPLVITYTPTELGDHKAKLLLSDGGLVGSVGVELSASCLEVPTLTTLTATDPTNVTDSSYVAHWTAAPEKIDYYLLNRVIYDSEGNDLSDESIVVDAEENSYAFNDLKPGQTHEYSVQSYRLGYTSLNSNVIEVKGREGGLKGDVNQDGKVDTSDITALINKILGTASWNDSNCDVNGDGKIDTSDITALISIILS